MIDSKTKRAKLAARREPYWYQVRAGGHVGYRKPDEGEGSWIAKWRDPATGKRSYRALGTITDDASRSAFDKAKREADAWFTLIEQGVAPQVVTVKDACEQYVATFRRAGDEAKAARTTADFRRLVYADTIASIELSKLRPDHLDAWRDRITTRPAHVGRGKREKDTARTPGTINRDMVPLRAALNRAHELALVATDTAWRRALKPIKNADRRRDIYLDRIERKAMLEAASAEVKPLLKALTLLPLRPGALAALKVSDFDRRVKTLKVGQDKAGADRRVMVPPETAVFLSEQARGKTPAAPLFAQADGSPWNKDRWKWPVKDAVTAAKLPAAATAYSLRHSVITDLVTAGLDLLTIAQISGTSVAMIEKHYGHLRQHHAAAALATLGL